MNHAPASTSKWDAGDYARVGGFVAELGEAALDLLDPQPGEAILDIGCGDGALTERIAERGASVVGIDNSESMVIAAKARGLDARLMDAAQLRFSEAFDAAFSNATLHWVLDKERAARSIWFALKPGGRFACEMGGAGNLAALREALDDMLVARGYGPPTYAANWYPTPDEFAAVYETAGFSDIDARLVHRPTPIEHGIAAWVTTFRKGWLDRAGVPEAERAEIAEAVAARFPDNVADYVRLRFIIEKARLMRYLPLSDADRSEMLGVIGAGSIDELFRDVPQEARLTGTIRGLPDHKSELEVERHLTRLARKNMVAGEVPFFLGCGAYRHHIPASVDHLIQRGEFLTSYTPYQPEIAQGTLQMLFEFQTQVARLYGCEVANASMYDGSTAMWEAIGMAGRITRRNLAILHEGVHPHYVSVARTMAKFTGDSLADRAPRLSADCSVEALIEEIEANEPSCVVVQYPDILGRITDLTPIAEAAHAKGALLIAVVTEPVALGLIKAPGEMGADIVVGEGQSIGVGLQFGGPYVGLFATREKFVRQMPGRLAGETVDAEGKRGFVLTLSTREQHIRREKATSNICTNSGLCALAFSIHMSLLGEKGLRQLAQLNHARARKVADRASAIPGVELVNDSFFNEFTLKLPVEARPAVHKMVEGGVLGGVSLGRLYPDEPHLANGLVVAVTETVTDDDITAFEAALKEAVR